MDVPALMNEMGTALDTIADLRVFPHFADRVSPPAATVGLPDQVNYDMTYGRGMDRLSIPMWVVVSRVDGRISRSEIASYLSGSGTHSVKAAFETYTFTEADDVRVSGALFEILNIAGVDYLSIRFETVISGSGAS